MNVFHKVTRETLKKNRLRTLVTIVGVILSAAMVCAVTTIVASFQSYLRNGQIYTSGDWYEQVAGAGADLKSELAEDSRVNQLASAQLLGYAASESKNEDKPFFYVLGADQCFLDSMPVHLTFGRLPESQGEILVPEHYLSAGNGGASVKIGDSLTLGLGERLIEGEPLNQNNPYLEEETLQVREIRTFTVVGIYERPDFEDFSAPGYTLITQPQTDGPQKYDLYLKTAVSDLESVIADHSLPDARNWDLLAMDGEFKYSNITSVFIGFAGILIFLIVLGSVTLIYSAFSISVSERTRQFGLLNSVGATKKQLRRSVLYEAAVISAIGIPIGILCGIGGIAVTLHFLGDKFQSLMAPQIPMTLRVSVPSVVIAVVIAVLTVLISVWLPAKRATKVTAIEAIRQNQDVQAKGKDVHVSKLIRKVFGLEGVLAKKHFRRSRKRYRATIVSLVLSLVLFISASSFCMYLTGTVEDTLTVANYDVSCDDIEADQMEAVFPSLLEARSVTAGTYYVRDYAMVLIVEQNQLDEGYAAYLKSGGGRRGYNALQDPEYTGSVVIQPDVFYVDDTAYRAFLQKQGLDERLYLDTQDLLPLVYNQGKDVNYEMGENGQYERKVYSYRVLSGDMDTLQVRQEQEIPGYVYVYTDNQSPVDMEQGVERFGPAQDYFAPEQLEDDGPDWSQGICRDPVTASLQLGASVTELPLGVSEGSGLILLYPFSAAPDSVKEQESAAVAVFTSDDHAATAADLEQILMAHGLYAGANQVRDLKGYEESDRNIITIINVFSYGFIVLISLIAAANVFNTISTNVALRRREFAMLRSVGMTRSGMNRMMNYECLLYGFRALAFGLPLSGLMTVFIYQIVGDAVNDSFRVPWSAVAVAVCSIFAVVFATMLYAMGRIKRENPIDALKNENT